MGRQKKIGNPRESMEQLAARATELFEEPYDDREGREEDLPSVRFVAEEMNTTVLRARKLLITAGYYSTEMSRKVRELHEQGVPVSGIMEATRLGQASVYSYLPYLGLAWNLEERTANADRLRAYRCVRESENGCKARKIKGRRRFRNKASLTSLPIYSKISSV